MKTYKKVIFLITSLIFQSLVISCENLLDVDSPANQITSDQVFENVQTANAALSGLYAGIWDNSPLAGDQAGKLLGIYTDDLNFYGTTSSNGLLDIFQNSQVDSNATIYSYWTNAYQKIYMANAIIEGINHSSGISTTDKSRIKGEALFIRSFLYFYLQQIFGDIPYITGTDYVINQSISKISSGEVLNHIVTDLNESSSLLVDQYRNSERIFPNRKVSQLLLAKIYMLQSKWNDAQILLQGIVQNPLYNFQNDITKVFDKSGTHILWQLKPKNSGDATKEIAAYYFSNSAPTSVALSTNLMNTFSTGDLRKQYWTAIVTASNNSWYRPNKYKNLSNNSTEYSIVFRLEEAYLMLAEVLAQQDKLAEALPYINATRTRAGISSLTIPITKSTLLSEILSEDRKEFFTEMGHRFLDLKRFNQLSILNLVKPNWKTYHQLWPLPQKELLLNSNLNPQNTGY